MRTLLAVCLLCLLLPGGLARAGTKAPPETETPSTAETAPAPTEPDVGTDGEDEGGGTIRGDNLWETLSRGGALMYPILLCSLVGLAFAIERAVSLRQSAVVPRGMPEAIIEAVQEKGAPGGLELCEEKPSVLSRVMQAGLRVADGPKDEVTAAMQEAGERELWSLERLAKPLNVIAGVAPLLGLLGTVWGMILAFDVVAQKGALGDPKQLANGIATALLTTLAGLSVAIPSYIFYHYFRSKSDRMIVEIEETASHVVAALKGQTPDAHPTSS